jgi:hypothetical protein
MAIQIINVGTTANDTEGDSLRTAFIKVNSNFSELYTAFDNNFRGEQGPRGFPGLNGTNGKDGEKGDKGDTGAQGISVIIQGTKDFIADLPPPPEDSQSYAGQGWIVTEGGNNLWFWNLVEGAWNNLGPIVGPKGDKGDTGEKGEKGEAGLNGRDGIDGINGRNGTDGQDGIDGQDGQDAVWFWQGAYSNSVAYVEGDIIQFGGSTWRRNTVNPGLIGYIPGIGNNGELLWDPIAIKGEVGPKGDAGDALVPIDDSAPDTVTGTLWFNTEENRIYIKYNNQWVDASPIVIPPPDPNLEVNSIEFNDASIQTTAWTGSVSWDNVTDKPAVATSIDGGDAYTTYQIVPA